MIRTRLTNPVPGMDQTPPDGELDPKNPVVVTPLVAYLVSEGWPLTGQVLSARGSSIAINHGWSRGAQINKDKELWTVPELVAALTALPLEDPFGRLATALGGALCIHGRDSFEAMVNAEAAFQRPAVSGRRAWVMGGLVGGSTAGAGAV